MRICVFGAGAVGGYIAGRLAQGGRQVSIVARGAHLDAIRTRGLELRQAGHETVTVRMPASDRPADLGPQDLIIVSTKVPAIPDVAEAMQPMLTADTAVAFAVNGVFWFYGHGFTPPGGRADLSRLDPGGLLQRLIGAERSLGMVVFSPNNVLAPGVVENVAASNRFVLGEPRPSGDRAERLAEGLRGCGFGVEATDDVRRFMWGKLVRNAASSPLCALTGVSLIETFAAPGALAVARAMMHEALAVAAAHGFTGVGVDVEKDSAAIGRIPHKPSMLQDLERGRPMEIDSQLAILQDFARQSEVPTPSLDALLPLLVARARAAGCY